MDHGCHNLQYVLRSDESMRPVRTLLPVLLAHLCRHPAAAQEGGPGCDCAGCGSSSTKVLGLHETLLGPDPPCPEGSVATVVRLRTAATRGRYDLITWNSVEGLGADPYVHLDASLIDEGTTCAAGGDPAAGGLALPVVGDRSVLRVSLNCESLRCDFLYDVEFGCAGTGVTEAGGGLQVLSDVDDTIACSGATGTCDDVLECALEGTASAFLSGTDGRLEHKEMYPGVAELMLGLALGPGADADAGSGSGSGAPPSVPARAMMMSARPREAAAMLAIDQDSELNLYCEASGRRQGHPHWGINVDEGHYGSILDGTSFREFGQTKARSYLKVSAERPNTRFAFLGDNGQGDVCAAQSMLESENGDRMAVVLVHAVQPLEDTPSECESPEGRGEAFTLDLPEGGRVHYHRTHSEAATWALGRGFISCCSAAGVFGAVDEWIRCRCGDGVCPEMGLSTGVTANATRADTLGYCEELRADQEVLLAELERCDPKRLCLSWTEAFNASDHSTPYSASERVELSSQNIIIVAVCAGVGLVLLLACLIICFEKVGSRGSADVDSSTEENKNADSNVRG